ncbi:serpin B9-like isoform 2-T2 [Dama dama]|nr:serpin B9 isoform X2 [Dama dama]
MLMEERREPSNPGSVSDSRPGLMDALCEANGTFALRLLKALCEDDPSGNVFFSPVSLSSVLAMVLLGAKGDTAAQVAQVLSLNTEKEFHQDFQQLLAELNKPDAQYLLTTANRIFGEKTYEFLSTFKELCLRFYYAELEQLSFAEAAEPSRKQINAWVSKKTEGKIPELLPANSINAETRLILVNAVYFKGRWSEKFDKEYTREMPFRINQKEQRPVQMMFQDGVFRLARIQEVQAQVLELPYADEELSMLVLLPNDHVPLSSVEKHLTWEKFLAWTQPHSMKKTQVEVFLPKFKLEMTYDMVSVLQGLGVLEAFQSGRADFSAMSPSEGLCLSALAHKSVVEVDEEGTEAAAASAMLQVDSCMVNQPRFCADHPFLFFIRHNGSRSTLFCGRFSSP